MESQMNRTQNTKKVKLSATGRLYFAVMGWDLDAFLAAGHQVPAHCLGV